MIIGLISDTHGLLRPEVHTALAGVELILHAGDVGEDEILDELELIAPVRAVYGNTDERRPRLTAEIEFEIGGVRIHVSHGHEAGRLPDSLLDRYPHEVLVYGHTHKALITRAGERLLVNPGAAGPQRFDLVPSVAILAVEGGRTDVEIIPLE